MNSEDKSYYEGDSRSYFPLSHGMRVFHAGPVRFTSEYDEFAHGYDFKYSLDELIIDDNMLTYDERSVKFVNFADSTPMRW